MPLNKIQQQMLEQQVQNRLNKVDEHTAQLADVAINVKQFGAKGDKVFDNSQSFQQASNTAKHTVFIPDGDYLIKGDVTLKANTLYKGGEKTNIYFVGEAGFRLPTGAENIHFEKLNFIDDLKHTTVLEIAGTPYGTKIRVNENVFAVGDVLGASNFGVTDQPYMTVTDFDGTWYTLNTPINSDGSLLRPSWGPVIGNFNWKAMLIGGHLNHGTTIKNCTFHNARGFSFTLPRSNNVVVEDCLFTDNGLDFCLFSAENDGEVVQNIEVKRCRFENHIDFGKQGIVFAGNHQGAIIQNVTVEDCYFNRISESAFSGEYAYGLFKTVRLLNNYFENIDLDAICVGGEDIIIQGNTVKGNVTSGVVRIGGYSGSDGYYPTSKIKNVRAINNHITGKNGITVNRTVIRGTTNYVEPIDIILEGNNIEADFTSVVVGGKHLKILNNVLRSKSGSGDSFDLAAISLINTVNDCIIKGNTLYEKAWIKYTNQSKDVLIEENIFNPDSTAGDSTVKLYDVSSNASTSVVVRDNLFYVSNGMSLSVNAESGFDVHFYNNKAITGTGTIIKIPRNRGVAARWTDSESIASAENSWISNLDNSWLGKVYTPKLYHSSFKPDKGYYEAGDLVLNTGAGAERGWARLTTGTSHVLGTDWKAI